MKNKKLLFFSLFFIIIISLGAAYASEDIKNTDLSLNEANQDDGNIDLNLEEDDNSDNTDEEDGQNIENTNNGDIQPSEPTDIPDSGNDSNDPNSPSSVETNQKTFTDIQNLIDEAKAGSTIKLNGTYIGNSTEIVINKALTIKGVDGKATLDAKFLSRIFNIKTNGVVLENLNLINGKSDFGGAIRSKNKFTVKNCNFKDNRAKYGGAIYSDSNNFEAYSTIIDKSTFKNNTARSGGAIYSGANLKVLNSNFTSNTANSGGAICCEDDDDDYFRDKVYINNCRFNKNRALTVKEDPNYPITYPSGGALLLDFKKAYINNTIFKSNSAKTKGGAISLTRSLTIKNCKFDNNTAPKGSVLDVRPNIIDFEDFSYDGIIKITDCVVGTNKAENNVLFNCNYQTIVMEITNLVMGKYKYTIRERGNKDYFIVKLTNKKTNKAVKGAKLRLKLRYWEYGVKDERNFATIKKTDKNGKVCYEINSMVKIVDTSGINFYVSLANSKQYPIMSFGYPSGNIPLIVKAPKVTAKYKKSKYFNVNLKDNVTKKSVKNAKIMIKVYTGKKFKAYKLKTNKKGSAKINTKTLSKGKHKVVISLYKITGWYKEKGVRKYSGEYKTIKKSSITIK